MRVIIPLQIVPVFAFACFLPFKLIRWKLVGNDGYYKMTFGLLLKKY